ncbi:MAG: hypothetical protein JXQ29_11295 [Planctomycetes bacterium]|nr:hypothetical protein [Planctomycetota bacterium]
MRVSLLVIAALLAACASTGGDVPYPAVQQIIDRIAAEHPDLVRLTLHAVPLGKTQCTQLASTMAERRGKPSDPEDREAMRTGKEVVLDEPGAIDVTVPILEVGGKPTAIAGVTLRAGETADRNAVIGQARKIAGDLAAAVKTAGKPLW